MAKKQPVNKSVQPTENKRGKALVRIRVKPFRGIGGIGGPGTVAEVPTDQAREWVETGYAEYVEEDESK